MTPQISSWHSTVKFGANLILTAFFVGFFGPSSVGDELRKVQREYLDKVLPVLKEACFDCHAGDGADAGFSLEGYETIDQILKARKKWKKVLNRVAAKEMPPEDAGSLSDQQHKLVMDWIDKMLNSVDCSSPNPGKITIRRLNRTEYRNTIRDLVGIDYQPAKEFPGDDVGYGFDNIADVLSLPPILMEKYLDAAEKIMEQAIIDPTKPLYQKWIGGNEFKGGSGTHVTGNIQTFSSNGTIKKKVQFPVTGEYKIEIRAYGTPADNKWPKMDVLFGKRRIGSRLVTGSESEPGKYTIETRVRAGEQQLGISFTNDLWLPEKKEDRNMYVVSVMVSGPWNTFPESHKKLVPHSPTERQAQSKAARSAINSFASKAYRRNVFRDELGRLMSLYELARNEGDNHELALRHCFQAVLVSPFFLYKVEIPAKAGTSRQINDFELATSLSYFFWSSMPDIELFKLASKKQLKNKKVYRAQLQRMLKDPKASALVDNFVGQWLQLGHLDHIKPDPELFPGVDESLLRDMARETKMLIADVIQRDGSVLEILDTDFTFLNQRLADHYGIPNVKGEMFRRVDLGKSRRRGLMTHASILTLTSNPNRTSPVKRGKWIMENLLGDEPPPPDPNAMALDEQRELKGTLRQRLEQHRADPNCAVCHTVMDELGFALENFDAVGKWRDKEDSNTIDARGELPDGTKFEGAIELQKVLRSAMREKFIRCLTEKMLIYALGRGLEYYDECEVDKIINQLKEDNYRFSTLVFAVANSRPFLNRRSPEEN